MRSPEYRRWRSAHRGLKPGRRKKPVPFKKAHRFWIGARWHLWRLRRKYPDGHRMTAYSCQWHDDFRLGPTARKHWHVGRDDKWGLHTY